MPQYRCLHRKGNCPQQAGSQDGNTHFKKGFPYITTAFSDNTIPEFFIKQFDNLKRSYDYIIIDFGDIKDNVQLLKKIDIHIILVEANLLGIDDVRKILYNLAIKQKIQKDNIKIVFNKYSITSISDRILNKIFIDFEIFGYIHYDKYYNLFVNKKTEILTNRIKKEYQKIIKKLEE